MKRLVAGLLLITGCTPALKPLECPPAVVCPAPTVATGPQLVRLEPHQHPPLIDDGDRESLRQAAQQSLNHYRSRPSAEVYRVAAATYSAREMAVSMQRFLTLLEQNSEGAGLIAALRREFDIYQSVGTDAERTVTFSAYYEPTYSARLERDASYRFPYYGRPKDLITADLGKFDPAWQGARISGRVQGRNLVPYHTRTEIDSQGALKGKAEPIAWAKTPTDIFFMQIEGSGWLDVGNNKRVRIRYDGDNGRKYRSAGLNVINTGRIPKDKFHHDTFEHYLNTHVSERQELLNYNDRYVFFRLDHSTMSPYAFGNLEVPLTPRRSVAMDPKVFPKGALLWMSTDQPVLNDRDVVVSTAPLTRFVLSQDEGGAIQGPGRLDYFVGEGKEAHRFATRFWRKGTLYLLVKKRG